MHISTVVNFIGHHWGLFWLGVNFTFSNIKRYLLFAIKNYISYWRLLWVGTSLGFQFIIFGVKRYLLLCKPATYTFLSDWYDAHVGLPVKWWYVLFFVLFSILINFYVLKWLLKWVIHGIKAAYTLYGAGKKEIDS